MKPLLVISITLLHLVLLSAQTLYLHGGLSHSKLDWELSFGNGPGIKQYLKPVVGYALGLGAGYFDKGLFSLRSDASFYRSGGQFTAGETSQYGQDSEVLLDYATLSTCVNINPLHGKTKVQLSLGPKLDWLLKDRHQPSLDYLTDQEAVPQLNFGIMGGLGLHRLFGKTSIGVQGWWLGRARKLVDLAIENSPRGFGIEAAERVFLFQLSVGYKIK